MEVSHHRDRARVLGMPPDDFCPGQEVDFIMQGDHLLRAVRPKTIIRREMYHVEPVLRHDPMHEEVMIYARYAISPGQAAHHHMPGQSRQRSEEHTSELQSPL